MSTFEIYCVTDRASCRGDFYSRLDSVARAHPDAVILREKGMEDTEYLSEAVKAGEICVRRGVPLILHGHAAVAVELKAWNIHLAFPELLASDDDILRNFSRVGCSVHGADEASEAERRGVTYIIAGHIFDTDCKRGTPGRGTGYLSGICSAVSVPVYGIGGITPENIGEIKRTGAVGACVMSSIMSCRDPAEYLGRLRRG